LKAADDIGEEVGVYGDVAIHIDAVADGRGGGKGLEEFELFEIESLELFCPEGGGFCSKIWKRGVTADAGDSFFPEKAVGSGVGADDTEFPRDFDAPKMSEKVKSHKLVAVAGERKDKGPVRC